MTPRGRPPRSWGNSPPDRLAGCAQYFLYFIGLLLLGAMIGGALQETIGPPLKVIGVGRNSSNGTAGNVNCTLDPRLCKDGERP